MYSFFSGHVQGVDFAIKSLPLLKAFDLTGYVKNLNDGRIKLLAEGHESEVLAFIKRLNLN